MPYEKVTVEQAKELMDEMDEYTIVDVRTKEEYAKGHLKNAILIPDYEIGFRAEEKLEDKDQTIFVYCLSGNRSRPSALRLATMGYTNVKDMGGIKDWPYELEQ